MKYKGQKLSGRNTETIVIPRGHGEDIVLVAEAVMDFDGFLKACPEPKPPAKIVKGGGKEYNLDDPGYKQAVELWIEKQTAWLVIQSLKCNPELEWETIKDGDPKTWLNFKQELKDAGFSHIETQRIINGVNVANCLSERHLEKAREAFQRGRQAPQSESSGQSTEPASS